MTYKDYKDSRHRCILCDRSFDNLLVSSKLKKECLE